MVKPESTSPSFDPQPEPEKEAPRAGKQVPAARKGPSISRREFLQILGVVTAGGALAACAGAQEVARNPTPWYTPTPPRALESPQPPGTAEALQVAEPELAAFLALSSVLTGVADLNPELGRLYLRSVQENNELSGQLSPLYEMAGMAEGAPPENAANLEIATLEEAGAFEEEGTRSLADQIIRMWYTGEVELGGETIRATYVDALSWKGLRFTKPPTICAYMGFWAERPGLDIENPQP